MAFTQMKIDLGANMGTLRKANIASWKSPSSSFLQWEIDRSDPHLLSLWIFQRLPSWITQGCS